MIEVKAPHPYPTDKTKIFLGGSIDMGRAEPWQEQVAEALSDLDVIILNPRREDWDSTWKQEASNPQFREQVEWELTAQDAADINLYVFGSTPKAAEDTEAPITLLELGLHIQGNTMVCCPEGYYRKGNVDIACEKHDVPVYGDLKSLVVDLRMILKGGTV